MLLRIVCLCALPESALGLLKERMLMNKLNHNIPCNILLAVLIVVLLVFQFLPGFWTYTTEEGEILNPSIQGLVWWPNDNEELIYSEDGFDMEPYRVSFTDERGRNLKRLEYPHNEIVYMPVAVLAFGALAVIFCVLKLKSYWTAIFSLLVGIFGVLGYMGEEVYRMNSMWVVHLMLCVAILVVSAISLVVSITNTVIKLKRDGLL